jgi:ACS family D-galactonate transporter-like MFS transporter
LAKTQNIKIATIGYSTLIIFGSGFIGEMIAGWISDTWRKRGGSYNTVMHTIFVISGIMTTSAVILLRYTTSLFQAIGLLSIALFFVRWAGLYWSVPAAISQREHVGLVGSVMNICSNTMGILTPLAVGIIVSRTGSYDMALMMFAVSGGIFTLSSFMIDFTRKVGDPR